MNPRELLWPIQGAELRPFPLQLSRERIKKGDHSSKGERDASTGSIIESSSYRLFKELLSFPQSGTRLEERHVAFKHASKKEIHGGAWH
jgi:hypothetical protein